MAVALDHIDEALFAEFAKFVLGLSNAVAVGDEDVARIERDRALFIYETIQQTNNGAAAIETAPKRARIV